MSAPYRGLLCLFLLRDSVYPLFVDELADIELLILLLISSSGCEEHRRECVNFPVVSELPIHGYFYRRTDAMVFTYPR